MFELSLIKKYLHPRWKQLSVSIVSIVSVLVIALVVWLILVFLSVTNGIEKKWTEKLVALSAPMQITPTDAYYQSDYYQFDGISYLADYSYKTIEEKQTSSLSYDPSVDEEPKGNWIPTEGKDLVKEVFESISSTKGLGKLSACDFEVSVSNARFRLLRSSDTCDLGQGANSQSFLNQIAYLSSFDSQNERLQNILLEPSMKDLTNVFSLLGSSGENIQQDQPEKDPLVSHKDFQSRLKTFLQHVEITHLRVSDKGYLFHKDFFPKKGKLKAVLINNNTLIVPQSTQQLAELKKSYELLNLKAEIAQIDLGQNTLLVDRTKTPLSSYYLSLNQDTQLPAKLITSSIKSAIYPGHLKFCLDAKIQGLSFTGEIPFHNLEIGNVKVNQDSVKPSPFWAYCTQSDSNKKLFLPQDPQAGEGVLLPKMFRDQDVLMGDRGYFSYQTNTASSLQEMRIPVFVAGFYDPGLIPNAGKIILAPKKIISSINASINVKDSLIGNGINVWFDNIHQAHQVKEALTQAFKKRGIEPFWEIKTYREYEFSKDFIEQVSSDKTIFSLIAVLIIVVACTNIISMLILLVNNKKREIGILEAMGASKRSIAVIFGGCGLVIGLLSSALGTIGAYFTLKNIHHLINFISKLQGHQAFNPAFFGDTLPTELNLEAFKFVFIATLIMSLLAGLIPAIKAMRLNTTDILRSER
ncbi:MAG: hypothetical protein S4CHLAM7_05680 [Chlamydiae bacterium]|nr:hypothetical protein [Chlamydiota bacterium]